MSRRQSINVVASQERRVEEAITEFSGTTPEMFSDREWLSYLINLSKLKKELLYTNIFCVSSSHRKTGGKFQIIRNIMKYFCPCAFLY